MTIVRLVLSVITVAGIGIAKVPLPLVESYIEDKSLTLLLSDYEMPAGNMHIIYQSHKYLTQNAEIAKSPTKIIKTQSNHIFASIIAYIKLEKLHLANEMNHFAIKSKIYLSALKAAFKELTILKDSSVYA